MNATQWKSKAHWCVHMASAAAYWNVPRRITAKEDQHGNCPNEVPFYLNTFFHFQSVFLCCIEIFFISCAEPNTSKIETEPEYYLHFSKKKYRFIMWNKAKKKRRSNMIVVPSQQQQQRVISFALLILLISRIRIFCLSCRHQHSVMISLVSLLTSATKKTRTLESHILLDD